jgi:hypothetical protein
MKKASAILATIVVALTAACEPPPEFITSLSDPGSAEYDEWVLGHWYQWDGRDPIWHVQVYSAGNPGGPKKKLEINLAYQDKGGGFLWRFTAFPSSLDEVLYYNLVRTQSANTTDYTAPDEKPGHIIVRPYHLTPYTMMVCVLLWPLDRESDITDALKGTGLTPRFARVPRRVNGSRVSPGDEGGLLHTLVDGSREDLLRLVRKDPGLGLFWSYVLAHSIGKAAVITEEGSGVDGAHSRAQARMRY